MHSLFPSPLLFIILLLCIINVRGDYTGLRVVKVQLDTEEQIQAATNLGSDIWNIGGTLKIGQNCMTMDDLGVVTLYSYNCPLVWLQPDLQKDIDREQRELSIDPADDDDFSIEEDDFYDLYHNYSDIRNKIDGLVLEEPDLLTSMSIGTTSGGNDIMMLKLTGLASGPKKKVLVIGGMEPRAWVSPAVVMYFVETLMGLYGIDPNITALLNQTELHMLPVANPDGYIYSWETDRLWRKNRNQNGVDVDKNFDSLLWSSLCTNPSSSNAYCGISPFSEIESASIRDYVTQNGPFASAVDYIGFGQIVIRPYSYTSILPLTASTLQTIGDGIASTISAVNGANYTSQVAFNVYNSSNARDWFFSFADIPLSYTIAVRDNLEGYGYILPVPEIILACQENLAGFLYLLYSVVGDGNGDLLDLVLNLSL